MTNEMKYLMQLYACGAAGRKAAPPCEPVDWEKVVGLAVEQSITYTVAMAIKKSDTGCPDGIKERLMSSLMGASLKNQIKTAGILELLGGLEKSNIHTVLLKGIDVARFYKNPECRVSADTDILVPPEQVNAALSLLIKEGCVVEPKTREMHHHVCTHPALGMIELHIALWEDMVDDVLFGSSGISEASVQPRRLVSTDDGEFYALGSTDALMFLTLHMIKHFIIGGMSLRMMMDTALYFKNQKDSIDVDEYWSFLRKLRFDTLVNSVFGAMIKYCGFSREDFPRLGDYSDKNISDILDDLEKGGWQGKKDEVNRKDGWFFLKRERQQRQMGAFKSFVAIYSDILKDKLYALFPPSAHMVPDYPKLLKCKWLYPFCWLHRLFTRGLKAELHGRTRSRKNISDEDRLALAGKERLKLFRRLGIM